jgi:mannose-1-phosphate guanylyltransferase/phosphomannomutase
MRSKSRLTITLSKDLLDQIDQTIDGKIVRNRSHAIEVLLEESLRPRVSTSVILAGGAHAENPPPPLRPVGSKPLLSNTLDLLKRHGIKVVYILSGNVPHVLREAVGETNHHGMVLQYVYEGKPLGTAGAVLAIAGELSSDPFLVIHGDVLTNINLSELIAFHKHENTLATIAVKPREAERKYGKVMLQGNRITEFLGKEVSEGMSIVNTGVYVIHPDALRLVHGKPPRYFEAHLFPRLAEIGELSAFMFQGIWFDISQEDSYQQALARWG